MVLRGEAGNTDRGKFSKDFIPQLNITSFVCGSRAATGGFHDYVEVCSFYSCFLESFDHKWMLNFVKGFLCIY